MLPLIASALLIAYLLVPASLYQIVFSLFIAPKNFERSRADQLRVAVLRAFVPMALAIFLLFRFGWSGRHPFQLPLNTDSQKIMDYRTVFNDAYSETSFDKDPAQFWRALNHVARRQARLLAWFYLGMALEAIILGAAAGKLWWFVREMDRDLGWWAYYGSRCRHWIADHVLVPQISEWYLLLSTARLSPDLRQQVEFLEIDVLLSRGPLYRGITAPKTWGGHRGTNESKQESKRPLLAPYFLDKEGRLSGLLLENAQRFDLRQYRSDRLAGTPKNNEKYWKKISGNTLYVPYDKIVNLNAKPVQRISPERLAELVQFLKDLNIRNVRVTTSSSSVPTPVQPQKMSSEST